MSWRPSSSICSSFQSPAVTTRSASSSATPCSKGITMRIYLKQAFRPLFPLTALYGALGISVWLLGLSGVLPLPPQATLWHAHEMLFGFAAALTAGFALTAVENWTHAKSVSPGAQIGRASCRERVCQYV